MTTECKSSRHLPSQFPFAFQVGILASRSSRSSSCKTKIILQTVWTASETPRVGDKLFHLTFQIKNILSPLTSFRRSCPSGPPGLRPESRQPRLRTRKPRQTISSILINQKTNILSQLNHLRSYVDGLVRLDRWAPPKISFNHASRESETKNILFQILKRTTPKTTCQKCRGLLPRQLQAKHHTIYRHN